MPDIVALASSVAVIVLAAVLLRNVVGGGGPQPDPADAVTRELAHVLQSVDITRPREQQIAVMVVALPDYARLVREPSLAPVFGGINTFYRLATEVADRHKGEVASLVGAELCVVFGRILPVERPLLVAGHAALEIAKRLGEQLPADLPGCRGASIGVAYGPALSGPVGGDARRTYGTVGVPVEDAQRIARAGAPGEVRVPAALAETLAPDFELAEIADDATARRLVSAKTPLPAPSAPPAAPPA
jgi:class 3 adenylate cyclase